MIFTVLSFFRRDLRLQKTKKKEFRNRSVSVWPDVGCRAPLELCQTPPLPTTPLSLPWEGVITVGGLAAAAAAAAAAKVRAPPGCTQQDLQKTNE